MRGLIPFRLCTSTQSYRRFADSHGVPCAVLVPAKRPPVALSAARLYARLYYLASAMDMTDIKYDARALLKRICRSSPSLFLFLSFSLFLCRLFCPQCSSASPSRRRRDLSLPTELSDVAISLCSPHIDVPFSALHASHAPPSHVAIAAALVLALKVVCGLGTASPQAWLRTLGISSRGGPGEADPEAVLEDCVRVVRVERPGGAARGEAGARGGRATARRVDDDLDASELQWMWAALPPRCWVGWARGRMWDRAFEKGDGRAAVGGNCGACREGCDRVGSVSSCFAPLSPPQGSPDGKARV